MIEQININDVAKYFGISAVTFRRRLQSLDIQIYNSKIDKMLFDEWKNEKENSMQLDIILNDLYIKLGGTNTIFRTINKMKVIVSGNDFYGARVYTNPIWNKEKHLDNIYFVKNADIDLIKSGIYEPILFHVADDNRILEYLITNTLHNSKKTNIHNTINYVSDFSKEINDIKHINELINFLRFNLLKDIHLMNDDDFKKLIQFASANISGPAEQLLIKYHSFLKKKKLINTTTIISFNKHQNESCKTIMPYDINTYYSIAYMVFNEKYWSKNKMIQKAVHSYTNAKVWLYHAMHFISAWRSSDIRSKLPRFKLSDTPEITLEKIRNRQYTDKEYMTVAEEVFYKFQYRNWNKKPKKIKTNSSAQSLRIQIAESVKPVLGMLAMLCEAHNEINNDARSLCEMHSIDYKLGYRLFGQPYADLLGNTVFSNRRANKSFMNLLSKSAEKESIDGYMIAAYARSHTGGFEHIPEVTSRYLKAKMDGHTPDEIAKCLFERGVCSFVPYLLCATLNKEIFQNKGICEQTQEMLNIELSPNYIEGILSTENKLSDICKKHINDIMGWTHTDDIRMVSRSIIENIVSGNSCGKEEGIYCLAKACGKGCVCRQRESCVGCGNEMYTKTLFIMLSQEIYKQETHLDAVKTKTEQIKRAAMLDNKLYPAAYEMLSALSKVYSVDISEYKQIIKRSKIYVIIGNV